MRPRLMIAVLLAAVRIRLSLKTVAPEIADVQLIVTAPLTDSSPDERFVVLADWASAEPVTKV